jgi:ferredoxin-NADP reductase
MTVVELSLYISFAIFLQAAAFASLAFLRHWRVYQDLKRRFVGFGTGLAGDVGRPKTSPSIVAGHTAPWEGFRDFRVVRKVFEDESRSICSFHLVPTDDQALPYFEPGQFLTFRLDAHGPATGGNKEIVRCYSLSDRPGLDHYRISVKRALPPADSPSLPPGLSSNQLHDTVQEGDVLAARAPGGHFCLELGKGPIVLIAGGIGVTPMLSMLNTSVLNGSSREIWLFYGVRNSTEHIMKTQLEALAREHPNFQLHVCYSKPLPGDVKGSDYQHKGHVDIALLRLTLSLSPYDFYVCGPRAMMETLVPALTQWGVPDQNIHYEAFGPASLTGLVDRQTGAEEEGPASDSIAVTFSRSGKSVIWDQSSESLLDFAEKNGVDVSAGCRAGGCGSCQTTIEEGKVDYLQAPDFDPDPGCCLLCISRPKSDLTLSA